MGLYQALRLITSKKMRGRVHFPVMFHVKAMTFFIEWNPTNVTMGLPVPNVEPDQGKDIVSNHFPPVAIGEGGDEETVSDENAPKDENRAESGVYTAVDLGNTVGGGEVQGTGAYGGVLLWGIIPPPFPL